jgi:hypothetical protein
MLGDDDRVSHTHTREASPCSHEQLQLRGRDGSDCFILVLLCLEWEINMEGRGDRRSADDDSSEERQVKKKEKT